MISNLVPQWMAHTLSGFDRLRGSGSLEVGVGWGGFCPVLSVIASGSPTYGS